MHGKIQNTFSNYYTITINNYTIQNYNKLVCYFYIKK